MGRRSLYDMKPGEKRWFHRPCEKCKKLFEKKGKYAIYCEKCKRKTSKNFVNVYWKNYHVVKAKIIRKYNIKDKMSPIQLLLFRKELLSLKKVPFKRVAK